nr:hypothetical protein [Tanacetum cinerariifolium]
MMPWTPYKLSTAHMESDPNHEYPSLIQTFIDTHTHDGVFAQDDARIKYALHRGDNGPGYRGQAAGHILGVGRVLSGRGKTTIFVDLPRGMYSQEEIDEMLSSRDKTIDEGKEEAKRQKRELKFGRGGSGSGGGGDEDADGDDDI